MANTSLEDNLLCWIFETNNLEALTDSIFSAYRVSSNEKEWQNKKDTS